MPLFDFVCRNCGQEQEILVRGSETPECQSCGGVALAKLLSAPIAHMGGAGGGERPTGGGGACGPGCGCH